jgi:tRNA A-37 threonylcarbamoyl transferase component Bud32
METLETLGKYEIKRPLGRGAMGTVYEGWDPIIERRVAIKTVKLPETADPETEEALARFRREAQAAGRLTHPNIVAVFDYGETNDLAYIVMEFVDGPPLKSLLDKQERFAVPETLRVMEDLLAGLQFSHERGVVHRDIKPANVMLTSSGQAKIADFGIARIESSSMTQAGTLLGTPAYMSPEQFMGQVVDARTDIYSSGVLLYQLLTGERPFEGGLSAIMHKALNTEPPAPSQLSVTAPPAFDALVRRAMAKRPEDRFPSAKAFADAIRTALSNQAEPAAASDDEATMVAAAPRAAPPPPPRPAAATEPAPRAAPIATPAARPSSVLVIAAAVAALVVLGGGGSWWFLLRTPTPAPAPTVIGTAAPQPPAAPAQDVAPPPATPPSDASQATAVATTNQTRVQPPPPNPVPAPVPQPPPAPVVQPDNQQLAMAGLDALRRQLTQWVNNQGCSLLGGNVGDGGSVTLNGLAGNRSIEDLRQGLASFVAPGQIDWRVTGVDAAFCPALNALHPAIPTFGATGGPRLGLQMADGKTRLRDGEPVRVRLTMPDFASRLRVDYVSHDGAVQHLYPQIASPKEGITADPSRTYAPGEPVNLGHPSWVISEPYGTDMIIAVASSDPLFDRPRLANAEAADVYLRDLQSAIDMARNRGARLAGAAVTLEALPK